MTFLQVNLIEIVTLIFSSLAIILSWKNRKNPLRENIYNRQLNQMSELYSMLVVIEETTMEWDVTKEHSESNKELDNVTDKVDSLIRELDNKFAVARLVLPESVAKDFSKVIDYFFILNIKIGLKKVSEVNVDEISDMMLELSNSVRDFIGLEKLSSINQRVIKT